MLPLHPARSIAARAFSQGVRYAQQSMGGNPSGMMPLPQIILYLNKTVDITTQRNKTT